MCALMYKKKGSHLKCLPFIRDLLWSGNIKSPQIIPGSQETCDDVNVNAGKPFARELFLFALLFDFGGVADGFTNVIEFGTPDRSLANDFESINSGGVNGENALNTLPM